VQCHNDQIEGEKIGPSCRPGTSHRKFTIENQAAMALHQSKKPIKTETGRWHYKNFNQTWEPD